MPPGFDRLESFDHDELTAKHCYFRCSRPPDVDGIKIFDKDNQAAKHCFFKPGEPARAWFLKIDPVRIVCMRVCLRVCVSTPEAINN